MASVEQMVRDVLTAAKEAGLLGRNPGDPQTLRPSDLTHPANVLAAHLREAEQERLRRAGRAESSITG